MFCLMCMDIEANKFLKDECNDEENEYLSVETEKEKIFTRSEPLQIRSLLEKVNEKEVVLQPDYQRNYVWDKKKESLLIESILMGIPLPIVYLNELKDGTEEVVDGQQRLTCIKKFLNNEFAFIPTLTSLEHLRNKTFGELDKQYQNKIKNTTISCIVITNDNKNDDLKYNIFQRLNSGAVKLNDTELRNCVYRGKYLSNLKELVKNDKFKKLLGIEELKVAQIRGKDINILTKIVAIEEKKYKYPLKKFLNDFLEEKQALPDDFCQRSIERLNKKFIKATNILYSLFGGKIRRYVYVDKSKKRFLERFLKTSEKEVTTEKLLNSNLIESLYVCFMNDKYNENNVMHCKDLIKDRIIDLMLNNDDFIKSIVGNSTTSTDKVVARHQIMQATIEQIIDNFPKQERCFTYEDKEKLYKQSQICKICHTKIENINDAEIDHIVRYCEGGETNLDNAQLVHRFCNRQKG